MVNPRPFIDRVPDSQKVSKLLTPSDGTSTASWVGLSEEGKARIKYPAGEDNPIVTEFESGKYAPGDLVSAHVATDGRVSRVFPSDSPGEGAQWYGSTGAAIGHVETKMYEVDTKQDYLEESLSEAQDELNKLPEIQQEAADAKAEAREAAAEALIRGFYFGSEPPDPGEHIQWARVVEADPGTLTMGPCTASSTRYMTTSDNPDVSALSGNVTFSVEVKASHYCLVSMQRGYSTSATGSLSYVSVSKTLSGSMLDTWVPITVTISASTYAKLGLRLYVSSSYYSIPIEWRNPSIKDTDGNELLTDRAFGNTWSQSNVNQPWEATLSTPHSQGQDLLRWDGSAWVPLELVAGKVIVAGSIDNILMSEGSIYAKNLYIDSDIWASVVTAMNIAAEDGTLANLKVTNEAIVNELIGKIVRAAEIIGGTITGATVQTSEESNRGIKLQGDTFTAFDSSGNIATRISPGVEKSIEVRSEGKLIKLNDMIFQTAVAYRSYSGNGWRAYAASGGSISGSIAQQGDLTTFPTRKALFQFSARIAVVTTQNNKSTITFHCGLRNQAEQSVVARPVSQTFDGVTGMGPVQQFLNFSWVGDIPGSSTLLKPIIVIAGTAGAGNKGALDVYIRELSLVVQPV